MIEMDIIDVEARSLRSEGDADANYGITHAPAIDREMSDLINLMHIYLPTELQTDAMRSQDIFTT
jgi:hypothetical protein